MGARSAAVAMPMLAMAAMKGALGPGAAMVAERCAQKNF
jgi:hypothetical protein